MFSFTSILVFFVFEITWHKKKVPRTAWPLCLFKCSQMKYEEIKFIENLPIPNIYDSMIFIVYLCTLRYHKKPIWFEEKPLNGFDYLLEKIYWALPIISKTNFKIQSTVKTNWRTMGQLVLDFLPPPFRLCLKRSFEDVGHFWPPFKNPNYLHTESWTSHRSLVVGRAVRGPWGPAPRTFRNP